MGLPCIQNDEDFSEIYQLIRDTREKIWHHVNQSIIQLYWEIGKYVTEKVQNDGWGKSTVRDLSGFILSRDPSAKGFSARNLWRMRQFYETWRDNEKVSALLTEITWSNHLHILSKTKSTEERIFYLTLASQNRYSERDFSRIIDSSTFERTMLANQKLSAVLTEFPISTKNVFKDQYMFDFLNLPDDHKETDLQHVLLQNLKKFLLELGPDFSLIGEEYLLQVGMKDFRIDILMHHRGLNCLVAVELKVTEFKPEYIGQLQFYLEALDRDVKKDHENPSIGILICKAKDDEVVEYALNRSISPTVITEYETKLIDKKILQRRLHSLSLD
jgi:predicted nuclease of restriction endonuclease-like (RecB) superfamily